MPTNNQTTTERANALLVRIDTLLLKMDERSQKVLANPEISTSESCKVALTDMANLVTLLGKFGCLLEDDFEVERDLFKGVSNKTRLGIMRAFVGHVAEGVNETVARLEALAVAMGIQPHERN